MGCNHGVLAQAPEAPPMVSVEPPDEMPLVTLEGEGASTLLGRIGDRSPAGRKYTGSRPGEPEKELVNSEVKKTKVNHQLQLPVRKLQLPLAKESDEARLAQMEIESLCRAVVEQLPNTGGNICILGGCEMHHPETKPLISAIAQRMAEVLPKDVSVLTGGLPGVQDHMVKSLSSSGFQNITNLVHFGQERGYGAIGEDLVAGADAAEKRKVFSLVGDVYLCFEGGPGVSEEARVAFGRGARVVPLAFLGGASGGDFGFPQQAFETPPWCSPEDWALLSKGPADELADTVVRVLNKALQDPCCRGCNARKMQDNSPDVVVTGPMCLVCGP